MNRMERGGNTGPKNRLKATNMRKLKSGIKLAVPDGHLQGGTRKLFREAGFDLKGYDKEERNYRPAHPEIQVKVIRPQEIPHLVKEGTYDVGVTGLDWLKETGVNVKRLLDLEYGRVQIVLAISRETKRWKTIKNANDLLKRAWNKEYGLTIATEYMHLTQRFISSRPFYKTKKISAPQLVLPWSQKRKSKTTVKIVLSYGLTEGKPPDDADAIVDNTTTGETLKENNLHVVDTVMKESTAWLIANIDCMNKPDVRAYIYNLKSMLKQVVMARKFIHIFANLPRYNEAKFRASRVWELAQQEVTIVKSNRGARIDLLISRDDYNEALATLHRDFKATDIVALRPERVAWPSKGTDGAKAP